MNDPKLPPHNQAAETAVLGAMLMSREAVADVVDHLRDPDAFYRPAHGHIFTAIMDLYAIGNPIDAVTVAEAIDRAGLLEAIGGPAVLLDLQTAVPSIGAVAHYARIVAEHDLLRQLIRTSGDIADLAYSNPTDVPAVVDQAESMMFAVAQKHTADTTRRIGELLDQNLDRLEALQEQQGRLSGTTTGYTDFDRLTGGLQAGALYVIGARPAVGKTAFALGLATTAAERSGRPAVFFSLEMGQLEVSQRILCSHARVDAGRIRSGRLDAGDWQRLSHAVGTLAETPIFIDDSPHTTITDLRARARRVQSRHGPLSVVVVDYIQLMQGRRNAESRQVEVAEMSRGLKLLARELDAPVVALAQLNRGVETRADKRPMLSDLRESGSLEQDADVVAFLYRDELYNDQTPDRGVAEVIVAKHRNGPVGTIKLAYLGQYTRFENMAILPGRAPVAAF